MDICYIPLSEWRFSTIQAHKIQALSSVNGHFYLTIKYFKKIFKCLWYKRINILIAN